eukprot:scaffold1013_cov108-Isochrysis_galbana.AAC.1
MRLTIAWGAPSAGVAKRMRMAWCLRAAGVRGNAKGSSNALIELMRINSLRITLHVAFPHVWGVLSSGIAGAKGMALWLTILPCAGSRGRFGDDWISMSMSVGAEAEGAARASASAGVCSMLIQK